MMMRPFRCVAPIFLASLALLGLSACGNSGGTTEGGVSRDNPEVWKSNFEKAAEAQRQGEAALKASRSN